MQQTVVGQRQGERHALLCRICQAGTDLPDDSSWIDRLNDFLASHRHAA